MDKGYYLQLLSEKTNGTLVAIHNKNGQGLLPPFWLDAYLVQNVAIHNKNGQGLLLIWDVTKVPNTSSQSTIKMDKGYYSSIMLYGVEHKTGSQSTIKMDKGYYMVRYVWVV